MQSIGFRQPGRMKSKAVTSQNPHQQLLSIAQKIIDSAADFTVQKKYYKLKEKLFQVSSAVKTPERLSTPKRLSSISKTMTNLKGGSTTVKRKEPCSNRKTDKSDFSEKRRTRCISTQSKKDLLKHSTENRKDNHKMESAFVSVCEETCTNLNLLRQKILRREYSRKHLKQIKPEIKSKVLKLLPQKSEVVPKLEAIEVAFDRVILALDVVSMKIKQQINDKKGTTEGPDLSDKMRKDNCWLLDKVEQLLNENYVLRSKVVNSAVDNVCEQVKGELTDRKS